MYDFSEKRKKQTHLFDCLTMALPTELIHSSFSCRSRESEEGSVRLPATAVPALLAVTLSESAMKNIVSLCVESSKAWALLMTSSAPLMERHLLMSTTPLGMEL